MGNKILAKGTAIANFVNGKWPNLAHGNHSGFYMGQVSDGIYILDQYPAAPADGPPERLGILRGDDPRANRTGTTQIDSLVGPYPEGKWLRCDYGLFGQISMAKRLPDETKECTVKKRKGEHAGENEVEVRCR